MDWLLKSDFRAPAVFVVEVVAGLFGQVLPTLLCERAMVDPVRLRDEPVRCTAEARPRPMLEMRRRW